MPSEVAMRHRLPRIGLVESREEFIVSRCAGRRVLHLGCAAAEACHTKLRDGDLLHLKILRVARQVTGIDLDRAALDKLVELGVPSLVCWDVERVAELELDGPVDVVLAGEILEHLSNPGRCLEGVARLLDGTGGSFIVTVPNAFSLRGFLPMALGRRELVLGDHTAYYSFTTLETLLERHRFVVVERYTYSSVSSVCSPAKRLLKRLWNASLLRLMPQLAEGIIAVARRA